MFAFTKHLCGNACGDGGENTEFWECDHCGIIYSRNRYSSGNHLSNEDDSYDELQVFYYGITKIELLAHAGFCLGDYSDYENKKILDLRKQKIRKISELQEKILALRGISSLKTIRKAKAKTAPIEICEGLAAIEIELEIVKKVVYAWCQYPYDIKAGEDVVVFEEDMELHPYSKGEVTALFVFK